MSTKIAITTRAAAADYRKRRAAALAADHDAREWLHVFVEDVEPSPDGPQGRTKPIQIHPVQVVYLLQESDGTTKVRVVGREWLHLADSPDEVQAHLKFVRQMQYF